MIKNGGTIDKETARNRGSFGRITRATHRFECFLSYKSKNYTFFGILDGLWNISIVYVSKYFCHKIDVWSLNYHSRYLGVIFLLHKLPKLAIVRLKLRDILAAAIVFDLLKSINIIFSRELVR